ncbi:MAG: aminoacyl-tRNA hydrolase [Candidatus Pacebacteria bacterium]|nr:aminoacyl-tRNA hydrolase [Candidatus Paceibacterota bacterium]
MIIFLGLGNPGKKYLNTRHNIGFRVLDKFQKEKNFPNFSFSRECAFSEKDNVLLLKPLTFMNNSGKVLKNKKISQLIVVHDDIDLKFGKIKIVKNRTSAGHKGIESIIQEIKTKNFTRIRIGISSEKKPLKTEFFVLKNFNFLERKKIENILEKSVLVMDSLINQGLEKTMNEYN